jgi:hypothetical protein
MVFIRGFCNPLLCVQPEGFHILFRELGRRGFLAIIMVMPFLWEVKEAHIHSIVDLIYP